MCSQFNVCDVPKTYKEGAFQFEPCYAVSLGRSAPVGELVCGHSERGGVERGFAKKVCEMGHVSLGPLFSLRGRRLNN